MNSKEKFFSNKDAVTKKYFIENHEKLTYQKKLISDMDRKHKEWAKILNDN